MEEIYYLHRIRRTNGTWDKGIEVKDKGTGPENLEAAEQSYHAYLGAWAFGKNAETDYVACYITDMNGNRLQWKRWEKRSEPEHEPVPEPEVEVVNE